MSLEKAIKHGKEHRKGYAERGKPGRYDHTCRPNGSCSYCKNNRLFSAKRRVEAVAKLQDDDYCGMQLAECSYHCCGEYCSCSGQSIK